MKRAQCWDLTITYSIIKIDDQEFMKPLVSTINILTKVNYTLRDIIYNCRAVPKL